ARELHREAKVGWDRGRPPGVGGGPVGPVERGVDLHRGEDPGVPLEVAPLAREPLGPAARDGPARAPDPEPVERNRDPRGVTLKLHAFDIARAPSRPTAEARNLTHGPRSPFTVYRSPESPRSPLTAYRSPFPPCIFCMPVPGHRNLTVLTHPLIQHKLTLLRDKRTSTRDFKELMAEIAMLMAYEVTQD